MNSLGERICFDIAWADVSVIVFVLFTVAALCLARTKRADAPWFWLVPFAMLVAAQAFKIYTHKDSTFMNGNDSSDLWKFYGETFYEAMVVLWAALLGAVFLVGTKSSAKTPPASPVDGSLRQPDDRAAAGTSPQPHSTKEEVAAETTLIAEVQQGPSGSEGAGEMTTFSQLLEKFRAHRSATASAPLRWKELLTVPGVLLLAVLLLIALPADWRELGWVRAMALVTVLACYLYGLWLLVLPLRTLVDPVPELMRELDKRFEQESRLRDYLQGVPAEQRRLMSARLERFMRRLSGASKVSQMAFVLSPLFAFLLELVSEGGLSSLERGPLLIGGMLLALLFGALIGIMQLRRALVELESLQFSLAAMPEGEGSQRG